MLRQDRYFLPAVEYLAEHSASTSIMHKEPMLHPILGRHKAPISFDSEFQDERMTYNPYKTVGIPPAERPTKRINDIPPNTLMVFHPILSPLHKPNVLGSSSEGVFSTVRAIFD